MSVCVATLRDSETGFTKDVEMEHEGNDAFGWWLQWCQGNYSCDCNRSIFLYDLSLEESWECSVSKSRIKLDRLLVDGVEVSIFDRYEEFKK